MTWDLRTVTGPSWSMNQVQGRRRQGRRRQDSENSDSSVLSLSGRADR